jgi:hypothetical protein
MITLPVATLSPVASWRLLLVNWASLPPKPSVAPAGRLSQAGALVLAREEAPAGKGVRRGGVKQQLHEMKDRARNCGAFPITCC